MNGNKILPDTNVFIHAFWDDRFFEKYLRVWLKKKKLLISSIVATEFLSGADPEEKELFEQLITRLDTLPVDTAIARIAADYRKEFRKKNYKLKLPDCLIAAQAKFYKTTLATFNPKHFPMRDIKILKV